MLKEGHNSEQSGADRKVDNRAVAGWAAGRARGTRKEGTKRVNWGLWLGCTMEQLEGEGEGLGLGLGQDLNFENTEGTWRDKRSNRRENNRR